MTTETKDVKYKTIEEVCFKAMEAIDVPFKVIDKYGRLANAHGKGNVGEVIEESHFGYKVNSRSEPDFKEIGVELKVTPYVRTKRGIRAKERLVLNIINYEKEYMTTFETSSFWHKNQKLLLMFYEYVKDVARGDLAVHAAQLFTYPETDLKIIRDDWDKIIAKIRAGKAHEISEGDTNYLGACTKGATKATNWVSQPCSSVPAQRRAYCLKLAYMNYLVNKIVLGIDIHEKIIANPKQIAHKTFEQYVEEKIAPYFGKSIPELCEQFHLQTNSKAVTEMVVAKILGLNGHINQTEEFLKANIVVKTIRVNANGRIKESMSFPYFDFCELVKEEWETSTFKEYLESSRFMFVIFKFDEAKVLHLEKVMFWNMPYQDLDEVKKVWTRTVEVLKQGVKIVPTSRGNTNNLPKSTENRVAHVRPHARDQQDVLPLPTGGFMPKQCFWLNNKYIAEQIDLKKK